MRPLDRPSRSHVAEGGEPRRRVGVEGRQLGRRAGVLVVAGELGPHGAGHRRARVEEVLRLAGVLGDAVQLGLRRVDELPAVAAERAQRRVAEVQLRVEALGVRLAVADAAARLQDRGARDAGHRRAADAHEVEHRRHEVDRAELSGDAGPGRQPARPREDERHLQSRVVDQRHQRPHVELQETLAHERRGHIVGDDALRQAFNDGRLAHARLADQGGIVLGAPGEDLDDAFDFGLAPDDRVELASLRPGWSGRWPAGRPSGSWPSRL